MTWLPEHWFDLVQSLGIVGSLLFAAYTTRRDERARRIGNSIAINEQYQNIQRELIRYPELQRIYQENADLKKLPISVGEEALVNMHIAQLSTVYRAMKHGEFVTLEGLQRDIQGFFPLPIPRAVWEKFSNVQDKNFFAFVKSCLRAKPSVCQ